MNVLIFFAETDLSLHACKPKENSTHYQSLEGKKAFLLFAHQFFGNINSCHGVLTVTIGSYLFGPSARMTVYNLIGRTSSPHACEGRAQLSRRGC
jgi:hypothetical protein